MIKLYGFAVSNYYNMVKAAMLEKGIAFEEVHAFPSQEDDYLGKSPMGKVPCLEVDDGFLTETGVILDYLEDRYPTISLYPQDPFEKAKVRELIKHLELYIELPARRLFPGVLFGGENSPKTIEDVEKQLKKGIKALVLMTV